jgi:hypothetical protein
LAQSPLNGPQVCLQIIRNELHFRSMKKFISTAAIGLSSILLLPAEQVDVEKDTLKSGFIKLTDSAPILIAKEKGFFEAEGLQVEINDGIEYDGKKPIEYINSHKIGNKD